MGGSGLVGWNRELRMVDGGRIMSEQDKFRLIVGEKSNEQGHIVETKAKTFKGARIALGRAVARYKGDGWGYVQTSFGGECLPHSMKKAHGWKQKAR